MTDTAPLTKKYAERVPAVTILADTTSAIVEAPFAGVVTGVSYTAVADVTGAASPSSRTLTLVNKGQDGTGTTVVATLALLGSVNLTANDEKDLTLSVVAHATEVAAGDILAWVSTHVGGTGLVDPGGLAQVEITRS